MDPTAVNGHLEAAARQQQAQQMLAQVLQQTMRQPSVIKQASPATLIELREYENGRAMLHVALPNGERWDIPLSPSQRRVLAQANGEPE